MGSPTSTRSEVELEIALMVIQEDAGRGAVEASGQVNGASGLAATVAPELCLSAAR